VEKMREAETTEEHLTGSGRLRGRVVITCHKSRPYHKRIEEVMGAIPPLAHE